jgi:hypothetical protein
MCALASFFSDGELFRNLFSHPLSDITFRNSGFVSPIDRLVGSCFAAVDHRKCEWPAIQEHSNLLGIKAIHAAINFNPRATVSKRAAS